MPVESIDELDTEALRASCIWSPARLSCGPFWQRCGKPDGSRKDRGSLEGMDEGERANASCVKGKPDESRDVAERGD